MTISKKILYILFTIIFIAVILLVSFHYHDIDKQNDADRCSLCEFINILKIACPLICPITIFIALLITIKTKQEKLLSIFCLRIFSCRAPPLS